MVLKKSKELPQVLNNMDITFTKSDKKLLLIFYVIAIPIYVYKDLDFGFWHLLSDTFIYCGLSLSALWVIVYKLFPRYFPDRQLFKLFTLTSVFLMVWGTIEINLYRYTNLFDGDLPDWSKHNYFTVFYNGFNVAVENTGVLLGVFLGKKYYDQQLDLQKKVKEKKENELRLLKSQIDPHFLFNNLNALDSLIDTEPLKAKEYLNRLSKLYRYLITTKDDDIVFLKDEITFVENYIYLMKSRYGDVYKFNIRGQSNDHTFIPPGALQTILENVIKHNGGSEAKPVQTVIQISDDSITVSNNLVPKIKPVDSTGTGLNNLMARYSLLTDDKVKIIGETNEKYSITIPLLKQVD